MDASRTNGDIAAGRKRAFEIQTNKLSRPLARLTARPRRTGGRDEQRVDTVAGPLYAWRRQDVIPQQRHRSKQPVQVIRGKKALVTGAASGIGRAIALMLAREGADLYLVDIDAEKLAATAREVQGLGVKVATGICDLTQPPQISATVAALVSRWGALDILVNNAGVAYYGPTHEMTAAHWSSMLAINLLAPIQLTRELIPLLCAQEEAHILNVCSFLGLVPMRKAAAYQTSKYGLVGLSLALRAEYAPGQLGVSAVCPGFVRTALIENFATGSPGQRRPAVPDWACTTADKVAEGAVRAIRRNQGIVVMTPLARAWWWGTRLSPRAVDWLTRRGWRQRERINVKQP
jgi:3-oxoacyl-[acyl-carrier protein] reductase